MYLICSAQSGCIQFGPLICCTMARVASTMSDSSNKIPSFESIRGGVQSYESGHVNIVQFRYWLELVLQNIKLSVDQEVICYIGKHLGPYKFICLNNREVCKIIREVINRVFHCSG